MTDPRRVDPPDCACPDCDTGASRRAGTQAEYERAAMHNPDPTED